MVNNDHREDTKNKNGIKPKVAILAKHVQLKLGKVSVSILFLGV